MNKEYGDDFLVSQMVLDVSEFLNKMGTHDPENVTEFMHKRIYFIQEELSELSKAAYNKDPAAVADTLVDLVYYILGTAISLHIPWQAVWDAVHEKNMQKVSGSFRGVDNDSVKPEGWESPDIKTILDKHLPIGSPLRSWK